MHFKITGNSRKFFIYKSNNLKVKCYCSYLNQCMPVGENWEFGTNQSVVSCTPTLFTKSGKVWKSGFDWPFSVIIQKKSPYEVREKPMGSNATLLCKLYVRADKKNMTFVVFCESVEVRELLTSPHHKSSVSSRQGLWSNSPSPSVNFPEINLVSSNY